MPLFQLPIPLPFVRRRRPVFSAASSGFGTLTTNPLKRNTGSIWASETGVTVFVYDRASGSLVVIKTGQTTNASGVMVITDASILVGVAYRLVYLMADGVSEGLRPRIVAT